MLLMRCLSQAWATSLRALMALAGAILLTLAVAAAKAPAYEPVGAELRVSTTGSEGDATRDGGVPATTYNPVANEFLVVWHADAGSADEEYEVFGQRLSAGGAELGPDFRISSAGSDGDPAFDAAGPAVAFNPAANEYLVTWQADGLADEDIDIFGQRVSAAGAEIGGDFQISNSGGFPASGFSTALAYNPTSNEYLVTWSGDPLATDNEFEIFGQRLSSTAAELGSDFRISNVGADGDASRDAILPALAYGSATGEFLVTWQGDGLATDDEDEIFGQRVSAGGAQLGSDFRISDVGTDGDASRFAARPAVAHDPLAGDFLVTWEGEGLATDGEVEIFGQRVSPAGTQVGGDLRISETGADGDPSRGAVLPTVEFNPTGGEYLVTWQADGLATDNEIEVFGQRLAPSAEDVGSQFRISSTGADGDANRGVSFSAIAPNPAADEYLVVWHADDLALDDEIEVFARRLGIVPAAATPTPGESPRSVRCRGERPTILGTPEPETLRGTAERDVIIAGAGDDVVVGLGGDDLICAGEGSDELRGDGGEDTIVGRDGPDLVYGGGGDDHLQGGEGGDKLFGGGGTDVLIGIGSRDAPADRASRDACRGGGGGDLLLECGPRSRVD